MNFSEVPTFVFLAGFALMVFAVCGLGEIVFKSPRLMAIAAVAGSALVAAILVGEAAAVWAVVMARLHGILP